MTVAAASPAEAFVARLADRPCCAAVVADSQLEIALHSDAPAIFMLRANGLELGPTIRRARAAGKAVAVHLDLVDGLRADHAGVEWLASLGADAIITSHGQLMSTIRSAGVVAIQRLLLSRRSLLETAVAALERSKPDIVEILPGVILPSVRHLLPEFAMPLLAGGFVRNAAEVDAILEAGAVAATTSTPELWAMRRAA